MEHKEIKSIFSDVYNNFYLKYKKSNEDALRSDEEWEQLIVDAECIMNKYHNCRLVRDMLLDLQEIFSIQEAAISE